MARSGKGLMVALVMVLGLWGCAQGNGVATGQAERIRQLEAKCAKIEAEHRSASSARDRLAKQLASLEEDAARMRKTLEIQKNVLRERDALRLEVDARTAERDAYQSRCQHFEQGLQTLLKQNQAMAPLPATPASTARTASANDGRS
jgi:chromosome segregation ATPase